MDGPAFDAATGAEEVCVVVVETSGDVEEVADVKCTVMKAGPDIF